MFNYIARCRMTLHDNLYYASHEFGRFYETEKHLHNYGLTYALGLVQPAPAYFNGTQEPRYQQDLQTTNVRNCYVTPASPLRVDFTFVTFKMATVTYYNSTPKENKNRVLFGRSKEVAPGSEYEFFVLAQEKQTLPRWIRLGKWMAKAEVTHKWYTLGTDIAQVVESKEPQLVDCPINPLDVVMDHVSTFNIVVMRPASLLTRARVTGPCCKLLADVAFGDRESDEKYVPLHMSYFTGEAVKL